MQDGAAVPLTVITNTANLGFPAAINQELKAARREYLVLLNNDVVVTDGLLRSDESSQQFDPPREDCTRVAKMARRRNCNLRYLRAIYVETVQTTWKGMRAPA